MVDAILTVLSIIGAALLSIGTAYGRLLGRLTCAALLVLPLGQAWQAALAWLGTDLLGVLGPLGAPAATLAAVGMLAATAAWAKAFWAAGTGPRRAGGPGPGMRAYRREVRRDVQRQIRVQYKQTKVRR